MKKKTPLILSLVSAVVFLGSVAVMAGPVYDAYFSKKTVSNIRFMGENVGRMTEEAVRAVVEKAATKEYNANIDINGTKINLDIDKSGVLLDQEASVDGVMKTGKNSIAEAFKARKGVSIEPVFKKDAELFKSVVDAKLSEKDAAFLNYVVDIKESVAEYTILTDNLCIDYENLMELAIGAVKENQTDKEIVATFKDFEWPDAEELRKDFDIPMRNAEMTVENGVAKYTAHVVGRELDFEALKENLENKKESFCVSYKKIKPEVYTEDLGDELFPDLLGKYTTYYSEGNVARSSNVRLAASKINGYIMNSGDVFSFNQVVEKRTYANGFKDAAVYSANGVENGVGGGICQVSSTLYPAVLYSDLKIVERRNHSYTVNYAKPGLDATVSYGTIDFRFKNTNPNPIKITATASGGAMTVRIYGTKKDQNTVSLNAVTLNTTPRGEKKIYDSSLPLGTSKVDTTGFDGATAQVYKYIKSPAGDVLSSENLGISTYIPLNKIIKYNDGAEEKTEPLETLPETQEHNEAKNEIKAPKQTQPEQTQPDRQEENFDNNVSQPENPVSEEAFLPENEELQAQLPEQEAVSPEISEEASEEAQKEAQKEASDENSEETDGN